MDIYTTNGAAAVRYPTGQTDAHYLAMEFAARLDELVDGADPPFSGGVDSGLPGADIEAIYIGLEQDWAAEAGLATIAWWSADTDFGVKVVTGSACINPACSGQELHIISRDYPLLLRAAWLTLHHLGWRHYQPNGIPGSEDLWICINRQEIISVDVDLVWRGAIDHLLPSIAGKTSNLAWSNGTDHHPGLLEGDLAGAIGMSPIPEAEPVGTWLRHMGWTASTNLQTNAAWGALIAHDADNANLLSPWDEPTLTGHYTNNRRSHKLYTDHDSVRLAAIAYANDKVDRAGLDWVSLARGDGDAEWEVSFDDPDFGLKLPVTRQLELADHVAAAPEFTGTGVVLQAYGRTAEQPTDVWPDPTKVCVVVVEAYRPPGRTTEQIVDDYVVEDGAGSFTARCPLGLYQYLYSAAWGQGSIVATVGSPDEVVRRANRVLYLSKRTASVSPRVLTGESMTSFGLYGLAYYIYMKLVLDVGRITEDLEIDEFTVEDFHRHRRRFMHDLFPTRGVRRRIGAWYQLLFDLEHKPLLSAHLVRLLWEQIDAGLSAATPGSVEERRVVEYAKYTRLLDLKNRFEAAAAAGQNNEAAYDVLMEWVFRIRDSGLADAVTFFASPLDDDLHEGLGLGTVFDALNEPPGDGRGVHGRRAAWDTTDPPISEFTDLSDNWIIDGFLNNPEHGLTDTEFTGPLVRLDITDGRARTVDPSLVPYRGKGKLQVWLIPGGETFTCNYRVDHGGGAVAFVNQATGAVDAEFPVTDDLTTSTELTEGQLYEIQLTTYATGDRIWLDWWTDSVEHHHVSFDPGRQGDPSGISFLQGRSHYFLVPDGVDAMHFYASIVTDLELFHLDPSTGLEVQDTTFAPASHSYQSHSVAGTGDRVLRIAGTKDDHARQFAVGFWLLNCPNLFALHPEELLRPRPLA